MHAERPEPSMRALILIAVLIGNFFVFQWAFDRAVLSQLESTILFVTISTALVIFAHAVSPALRHDRAGQRLEFFGFLAALVGVVATGAISQSPDAAEDYTRARDQVVNEQLFIRELVNEAYDPHCEGWTSSARPVRRAILEEIPYIESPEYEREMKARLDPLNYSCFLLWDARSVRQEGDYDEAITLLEEVSNLGAIVLPEGLIADVKTWTSDPFTIQTEAERLRSRAEWLEVAGGVFDPLSKFLVLMALSIGTGRTAFLSFSGRRSED